ncbi:hypothetical protein FRX31_002807 [Thalictrum thalictroides]|uniref:F-box domain-containing protein n=1 Tax=Thalictrum thalictroides TaxID=46969 RepID=A0A7J6XF01_THATH|nr:hypothetical protein FRX31_002807 [Thalictrum thalictroides]
MEEEGRGSSNKEKKKKLMVAIDERDCNHYDYRSSSSSSSLYMFIDQNFIDFGYLQAPSLGSSSSALLRTVQEQNNNSASAHLEKAMDILHQLPYDILSLIIQRLEFMDYHCGVSLICKNWRVACKKYCEFRSIPTPSDHIPWLMLRKSVTAPVLKFYRPLTNKTYKITSPALVCTNCLYSQDGWLLLHKELLQSPFNRLQRAFA